MEEKYSRIVSEDFRKAVSSVGRRINEKFLASYMELDKDCCEKFGVTIGGVTEYINRLNNARFAPGRDDVLPRLVRYKNLKTKFDHEVGAIRRVDELTKVDIRWLREFDRALQRKRDPISLYLRKAKKYARRKKLRRVIYAVTAGVIILLVVLLVIALNT